MRLSFQKKGTDERFGKMVPQNDGAVAVAGGGVLVRLNHSSQLASPPVKRHYGGSAKRKEDGGDIFRHDRGK
eukprot:299916-Prorocentrum_lima.AAC.1